MIRRRHRDPDIGVPVTARVLDVVVVSVVAEVLAGVVDRGEASVGVGLTLHREAGYPYKTMYGHS